MGLEGGEDSVARWDTYPLSDSAGGGSGGTEGRAGGARGTGCLCRDSIDGSSVSSEEGGGVHPARRKGGGVLSSTTEDGEECPVRHHAGDTSADHGHSGEGSGAAQAGGEEDEAGGGVAQPALQHL